MFAKKPAITRRGRSDKLLHPKELGISWPMAAAKNRSVYDGARRDKWERGERRRALAPDTDLHWDRQISLWIRTNHSHILKTWAGGGEEEEDNEEEGDEKKKKEEEEEEKKDEKEERKKKGGGSDRGGVGDKQHYHIRKRRRTKKKKKKKKKDGGGIGG